MGDDPKLDEKPTDGDDKSKLDADLKAENDKLRAELAKAGEGLQKLQQLEEDRAKREKDKAEKDRLKKEGAESLLKEKTAENESLAAKVKEYEDLQRKKVDEQFAALPDALKEPLALVKDKLGLADWASAVEKAVESAGSAEGDKTVFMAPGGPGKRSDGKRELSTKAREIMESLGIEVDDDQVAEIDVIRRIDEDSGQRQTVFTKSIAKLFKQIRGQQKDVAKVTGK